MESPEFRPLTDVWHDLVTIVELSTGLQFVLVEVEDERAQRFLRIRLKQLAENVGLPFHEPKENESALDFLQAEQRDSGHQGPREKNDVLRLLPLPDGPAQKFVLHRLNENRDNLRYDLRGVMFVVGGRGFLHNASTQAPDFWSVKEKVVELAAPLNQEPKKSAAKRIYPSPILPVFVPKRVENEKQSAPAPVTSAPAADSSRVDEQYDYDIFISYTYADRKVAEDLLERLTADGIRWISAATAKREGKTLDASLSEAITKSRYFAPIFSPDYANSRELERQLDLLFVTDPRAIMTRVLPILARDCVPPARLRVLRAIDWRTPGAANRSYGELHRVVRGIDLTKAADESRIVKRSPSGILLRILPYLGWLVIALLVSILEILWRIVTLDSGLLTPAFIAGTIAFFAFRNGAAQVGVFMAMLSVVMIFGWVQNESVSYELWPHQSGLKTKIEARFQRAWKWLRYR